MLSYRVKKHYQFTKYANIKVFIYKTHLTLPNGIGLLAAFEIILMLLPAVHYPLFLS